MSHGGDKDALDGPAITHTCQSGVTALQQERISRRTALAKYCAMFSMSASQAPELLQAFYTRLSRRYGAPGVCLLDFPGRWMVFRTEDLAAGVERAVMDIEPPRDHSTDDLAELESRAAFAVGEGHGATLVVMNRIRRASSPPVLTLSMWSLEHPVALTGDIEIDEAGRPVRIGLPDALPRA